MAQAATKINALLLLVSINILKKIHFALDELGQIQLGLQVWSSRGISDRSNHVYSPGMWLLRGFILLCPTLLAARLLFLSVIVSLQEYNQLEQGGWGWYKLNTTKLILLTNIQLCVDCCKLLLSFQRWSKVDFDSFGNFPCFIEVFNLSFPLIFMVSKIFHSHSLVKISLNVH